MYLQGIAKYLEAKGFGTYKEDAAGGNIFVGVMPEAPDDALALYASGGDTPDGTGYEDRYFQVIVRSGGPGVALQRAEDVYRALNLEDGVVLPDGTYLALCIGQQAGPVHIGPDEAGRQRYSLNFKADIQAN